MKQINKEEFLNRLYGLVSMNRLEFERLSKIPEEDSGAFFYIQESVRFGSLFMNNYKLMMTAETTNPEQTTYYLTDGGIPGFCSKEEYNALKKKSLVKIPDEDGDDVLADPDFSTDIDKEYEKMAYG